MKVPRKLAQEWRTKLARAGFQDLEAADRDGPLSDRGNLHPINETPEADADLAHRAESGGEYYRWAKGFLHAHRFRSSLERQIWAHHANGDGLLTTAAALGITYHDARAVVNRLKSMRVKQDNKVNKEFSCRKAKNLRSLTWDTTLDLAASMLMALRTRTKSSTSACAS